MINWNMNKKLDADAELPPTIIISNEPEVVTSGDIRATDNTIFFYSDVTTTSMLELNRLLVDMDVKLQNTKNVFGESFDPIIHLRINTYGGELYAVIATLEVISTLKSKVYTYVEGCCASAGTIMSIAGDKRVIGKHSNMLIHQLSGGTYGTYEQMQDAMDGSATLMKCLKGIYKQHTKIPMKKLDEILKRDLWLTAEECLSYGMVDEIV